MKFGEAGRWSLTTFPAYILINGILLTTRSNVHASDVMRHLRRPATETTQTWFLQLDWIMDANLCVILSCSKSSSNEMRQAQVHVFFFSISTNAIQCCVARRNLWRIPSSGRRNYCCSDFSHIFLVPWAVNWRFRVDISPTVYRLNGLYCNAHTSIAANVYIDNVVNYSSQKRKINL